MEARWKHELISADVHVAKLEIAVEFYRKEQRNSCSVGKSGYTTLQQGA